MPVTSRALISVHQNSFRKTVYAGILLLVAAFLFAFFTPVANAQADTNELSGASQDDAAFVTTPVSEEVMQDEEVTNKDFGVEESQVLPDSPRYAFTRLKRSFKETFTFDPVKKAELQLQHANQELHDAESLLERRGDLDGSAKAAGKAILRFENRVAKIEDHVEELTERHRDGEEDVSKFLDKILDRQIKQQKVLSHIEKQLVGQAPSEAGARALEHLHMAREKSAESVGGVLTQVEQTQGALVRRFDRVLEGQHGSDFKDLRNLEILKRIEDHSGENFEEAFHEIEEKAFRRFAQNMHSLESEDRSLKFDRYAAHVGGDETRHLEIFDRLKSVDNIPENLLQGAESAKDGFARRFAHKLEYIEEHFDFDQAAKERARAHAFGRFEGESADVGKLRAIEDLRQRIEIEDENIKRELDEQHKASIQSFKSAFTDGESANQVKEFERLSKKMAENPDPTTFRLLQELEETVKADPAKRAFVEKMEREAKEQFVEHSQNKKDFFERIASTNPEDIETFKKLQRDFAEHPEDFGPPPFGDEFLPPGQGPEGFGPPPFVDGKFSPPGRGFDKFFERAINTQTENLQDHLNNFDDPRAFEQFQKKFDNLPPGVIEEIKRREGGFDNQFNEKREKLRFDFEQEHRLDPFQEYRDENFSDEERKQFEQGAQPFIDDFRADEFDQRQAEDDFRQGIGLPCDDECQREERNRFDSHFDGERSQERPPINNPEAFEIRHEDGDRVDEGQRERFEFERREERRFENNEPQQPPPPVFPEERFEERPRFEHEGSRIEVREEVGIRDDREEFRREVRIDERPPEPREFDQPKVDEPRHEEDRNDAPAPPQQQPEQFSEPERAPAPEPQQFSQPPQPPPGDNSDPGPSDGGSFDSGGDHGGPGPQ